MQPKLESNFTEELRNAIYFLSWKSGNGNNLSWSQMPFQLIVTELSNA